MDELFENIGILDELMKKRREFRGEHQEVQDNQKNKNKKSVKKNGNKKETLRGTKTSASEKMIEELMLMSHTTLPVYFDHVINKTKTYLKQVENEYKIQALREKEEREKLKKIKEEEKSQRKAEMQLK